MNLLITTSEYRHKQIKGNLLTIKCFTTTQAADKDDQENTKSMVPKHSVHISMVH